MLGKITSLIALFFQKIAIELAGFAACGYIALNLMGLMPGQGVGNVFWLPYLIGGIISALFMR